LGVETCFATPDWDLITSGNWSNKWDVSVGSMTIKPAREKVLFFSDPYYYTPAIVAVPSDSTLTSLDQLANQSVCVGTSTTYEDWLNGKSDLPPSTIYAQPPAGVKVVSLSTDQDCPQALAAGRRDFVAYVTSETVVNSNIAAGLPVKKLDGKAVFSENLAAAFDKSSSLDPQSLIAAVNTVIQGMHSDGSLSALSNKWFGADLTQAPTK
jgi:polar amino acid transport system substrate-binding protein